MGEVRVSTPELPEAALEERDRIVARLVELIRTAGDAELDHIAGADPSAGPYRVSKHQAALRTIIFKRDGNMTDKHDYFPGEVVSMVAEDGDGHPARAFEIATAILMINALASRDADGAVSICWAENWPAYPEIDREFLEPLMYGFRWLADHAEDWDFPHDPEAVEPVPSREDIAVLVARAGRPVRKEVPPDGLA